MGGGATIEQVLEVGARVETATVEEEEKWYYDECVHVSSVSTVCACAIRRRSISLSYRIEISSIASRYESAWRWTRLKMVPK